MFGVWKLRTFLKKLVSKIAPVKVLDYFELYEDHYIFSVQWMWQLQVLGHRGPKMSSVNIVTYIRIKFLVSSLMALFLNSGGPRSSQICTTWGALDFRFVVRELEPQKGVPSDWWFTHLKLPFGMVHTGVPLIHIYCSCRFACFGSIWMKKSLESSSRDSLDDVVTVSLWNIEAVDELWPSVCFGHGNSMLGCFMVTSSHTEF